MSDPAGSGGFAPTAFEDVAWDGELGTHFCVAPQGTVVCPTSPLGPPPTLLDRSRMLFTSQTQGAAHLSGNLTMTWDAAQPSPTYALRAVSSAYTGCPDACRHARTFGETSGPSPLALSLDGIALQQGESLGIYLLPPYSNVANQKLWFGAGQPVQLAGTIASAPA